MNESTRNRAWKCTRLTNLLCQLRDTHPGTDGWAAIRGVVGELSTDAVAWHLKEARAARAEICKTCNNKCIVKLDRSAISAVMMPCPTCSYDSISPSVNPKVAAATPAKKDGAK